MKNFKHLLVTTLLLTSAVSFAQLEKGYNPYDCETNKSIELAGLQCVACGLTKFSGKDPSHKWLALLALKARESNLTHDGKGGPASSEEARQTLQKLVIKKLQDYSYCDSFKGKERVSKNMVDMPTGAWSDLYPFINRATRPSDKAYDKVAELFGFKNGVFSSGKKNMDYLFEGFNEDYSMEDKRKMFREKVSGAVKFEDNGGPPSSGNNFMESADDDKGLRNCLREIKERPVLADQESFRMCEVVAASCGIDRQPMTAGDFCMRKGMRLVVAPGTGTAAPARPALPPPPPPRPSQQGGTH